MKGILYLCLEQGSEEIQRSLSGVPPGGTGRMDFIMKVGDREMGRTALYTQISIQTELKYSCQNK